MSSIPVGSKDDDLEGGGGGGVNPLLSRAASSSTNNSSGGLMAEMDPLHPSGKQKKRKKTLDGS